jgi:hypothetical protein
VSLDPDFVDEGPASPNLSADLTFLAERMQVKIPPLPPSTKEELKLFNELMKENPEPNAKRYHAMAIIFKQRADGITIFPKLPSMLKAHTDRWKCNQLIKQNQMIMKDNFKQLSERLGAERVKMPPRELSKAPPIRSAVIRPNAKKGFVAPIVAPLQKEEVKVKKHDGRACACAPTCGRKAVECGGWMVHLCKYFGSNGSEKTDKTDQLLLLPKKKRSSASGGTPTDSPRDCAWWPYCTLPTTACGGWTGRRCVVYGAKGIFPAPSLAVTYAVDLRKQRAANQKATSRALTSANKRLKVDGESEVDNTGWLLLEPVWIPGPVDPQRGGCVVAPADSRNLLTFGTLLNDNIVQGYLNLLAVKFNELGISVRIVMPQFYPTLLQYGWTRVQNWVKGTGFMESNWQTAQIILVPIFTGSIYSGHWSGFTIDRRIPIGPTGIRVYKDSLPSQVASNNLKARLLSTPLVQDTSIWITADTPVQATGSNDCAVWMCCGFTAYLKAVKQETLLPRGTTYDGGQVGMTMRLNGLSSKDWGLAGRQHIHDSFRNGAINLDDPAIAALAVSICATQT